jgi:hypothetical protein
MSTSRCGRPPRLGLGRLPGFSDRISLRIYHLVMTNSLPWKITMFLIGKPYISMGHLYHGELLSNQRVSDNQRDLMG